MSFQLIQSLSWNQNTIHLHSERPTSIILSLDFSNDIEPQLTSYYQDWKVAYPKFHKMDLLSKIAMLAMHQFNINFEKFNPYSIAMIFNNLSGSESADLHFEESRKNFASPGLFVYTLPNIFMGEIAIKYNIKGPHICYQYNQKEQEEDFLVSRVQQELKKPSIKGVLWGSILAQAHRIELVFSFTEKE